jgi:dipeptidyl aminopeptidase/acylaminoacyl peptidase
VQQHGFQQIFLPTEKTMSHPFTVSDLYLHHHVSEIHCAASAGLAACVVKSVDEKNDQHVSCIWTFALDGSAARQLTRGPGQDMSPQWSPDGSRLAFISTRTGSSQVYLIEREGGEAWQVGDLPQGVSNLRWSPEGDALVICAAVAVDPDLRGERPLGREPSHKKCNPEVAWRLPYKEDGVGYLLGREFHLFRLDVRSGKHTPLTDGPFDVLAFDVAADGRIAFTRTREGRFAHNNDLWVCNADGTRPCRMTRDHAIVMAPHWSPDGSRVAFTGAREEGDAEPVLWLLQIDTGEVRPLCKDTVDVADPVSLQWEPDGERLVFSRAWRGRHQAVAVRVDDESLEVLSAKDRQMGAFWATPQYLVYAVNHPALPSELWVTKRTGGQQPESERRLSDFNSWWYTRDPIEVSVLEFEVPDGEGGTETIDGWFVRAKGSSGVQPLLCDVHGGPASYALLNYDTNVFWQAMCTRGWSVLALNAVGSASYGRDFCKRLAGHWGEYDLPQYLAAIEELRKDGLCDDRVVISGKSYGGFLCAYATGNTDIFKAAVVMAPVANIETHYGTSDGGYYADPFYMASKPTFDRELARALSPLHHIEKSKTPTLFMQGKDDERCPKCQSEELFVSLCRAGETTAELVLYPGETHGFLASGAPSCREDAALRIMDWFDRAALHKYTDPSVRRQAEPQAA